MSGQERQYVSEDKYQGSKKKLTKIAKLIMLGGVIIGLTLIATGVVKSVSKKQEQTKLELRLEELEARRSEIMTEEKEKLEIRLEELEPQQKELEKQQKDEFSSARGFSDRYYALGEESKKLAKEIKDMKDKVWDIEHDRFDIDLGEEYTGVVDEMKDINERQQEIRGNANITQFFVLGGNAIFVACIIGGFIFFITHRREISAFQTQAAMPIAKEGMEEMTPIVGQMMGTVAKEVKKSLYENEDTYRDIATKTADIESEAIRRNAQAVQEGFASAATGSKKVCPHCNSAIEGDSIFCEACGRLI